MEGKVQGGGGGTPVVGLAYDVASGMSGEGSCQEADMMQVVCEHSSLGRH